MDAFTKNQDGIRDQMQGAMAGAPAKAGFEALAKKNMEWFEGTMRMFTPAAETETGPAEAKADTQETSDVELGDLKVQLAQMQEQLSKLVDKS